MNRKRISACLAFGLSMLVLLGATGCQTTKKIQKESWEDETIAGTGSVTTIVSGQTQTVSGGAAGGKNTKTSSDKNGGVNEKTSINLKGATVTLAGWDTGMMPHTSDPDYAQQTALVTSIEKKYNCVLKGKTIAEWGDYKNSFITATMSGIKFADIMVEASEWIYPTQITSGYLTPLDQYVDCSSIIFNKANIEKLKINGKHYALAASSDIQIPQGIWFNKSVFSKFGVDTPDKYVKANNWTWDTFLQACKKLTQVSGGVQYYGWGATKINPAGVWVTSDGGSTVSIENGKRVFSLGSSAAIKGIQFASDLYHVHNVCPDPETSDTLFNKGQVAMCAASWWTGKDVMKALGSSNVGFTYIPRGPDVSSYHFEDQSVGAYVIPSTVKNPQEIANILVDYIYPYTWRPTLENKFASYFGDQTSLATAIAMGKATTGTNSTNTYYDYITQKVNWSDYGIFSNMSPQSFVDSVKAQAQSELDTIWKNVS